MIILLIFLLCITALSFVLCTMIKISYGYAVFITLFFLILCGAIFFKGKKPDEQIAKATTPPVIESSPVAAMEDIDIADEAHAPQEIVEPEQKNQEEEPKQSIISEEDQTKFEAIGDIEVDTGLFNVELIIPPEFTESFSDKAKTQVELEKIVEERGFISATFNDDGSITYIMTKDKHRELLDEVKQKINQNLEKVAGSEDYPDITSITANDNFTSFTITTLNEKPNLKESLYVMALYMYGGLYGIVNGERPSNIHIDYVNYDTGKIISSSDSEKTGADS